MAAETSSSAAASTPVVWVAAAAVASPRFEPIASKSVAAEFINSGVAITYDMAVHLLTSPPGCAWPQRSPVRTGMTYCLAPPGRGIKQRTTALRALRVTDYCTYYAAREYFSYIRVISGRGHAQARVTRAHSRVTRARDSC